MKKILAACALCGLFATPGLAASAAVESAAKTFEAVGNDAGKLKTYCELSKVMNSPDAEDESKEEEIGKQMDGFMETLGADFEAAFNVGADLDPSSPDGKAYEDAISKLDDKCAP